MTSFGRRARTRWLAWPSMRWSAGPSWRWGQSSSAGAPIGFAATRRALAEGRKDVPLLLSGPPLSLAAFVGYVLVLTKIIYPALGALAVHDAVNVALFLSVAGAFLVAAVVSVAAVSAAVGRSGIGERHFRFALASCAVAAVAMVAVLAGTVIWGVALRVQAPALFTSDNGILAIPTYATWVVIVSAMFLSCCVAVVAVLRGLSAGRSAVP
jgi:Na+-driven multidrug efflux pump